MGAMDRMLQEYLDVSVVVCLDDILGYSKFKEEYWVFIAAIYVMGALGKNSYTQSCGK